ncbi:cytochrome P450 709B2-like [Triticum dicoccoides]|uniref:cytochrome P450 709B2-like n=1 Tax=Triticum dicoccoides TaxID=85692 RepID=UPI000E798BCA|nr:cytochrome P450 709B2-like [Triticum dicoccoides]
MAFLVMLLLVVFPLLVVVATQLWDYAVMRLVWRPYAISKWFREQGIHGPSYGFLNGCNKDIRSLKEETDRLVLDVRDHKYLPRIAPHYLKWRAQYGDPFLYWHGAQARICVFNYELTRQILSSKSGHFVKNDVHPNFLALVGNGLGFMEGADWVRHRRIINPVFTIDKLKMMTKTMLDFAETMVKELEDQAPRNENGEKQLDISKFFSELTVHNISHAIFGSSYELGNKVFQAQIDLLRITMEAFLDVLIPGFKYLPTERNRRRWMLERELKSLLTKIIQPRLATSEYGNDLLGVMLDSCIETKQGGQQVDLSLSMDEIIHECKQFFFAGHDTTSQLLTWSVYLLCIYPEWQEKLRKEVLKEFGRESPNPNALNKLKEMAMVLLETLRLYPPALFMQRKTVTDMTVGSIKLPKGMSIVIPIPVMHRDKEVWGDDADEFNPLRFKNGITRAAKVPHGLLAFSIGPRSCIGQNFAMLEAKSTLALMLQKFSFTLSPDYVHAPVDMFTLKPKFGLLIFLRPLDKCN